MSSPYYFSTARRAIRAQANADGAAASNAAMVAVKTMDLDGARSLYETAAAHFKAAGMYDRQIACAKAAAYLEGFLARKAS
jgi:hypothetical protein